jgi:hypothetical protein
VETRIFLPDDILKLAFLAIVFDSENHHFLATQSNKQRKRLRLSVGCAYLCCGCVVVPQNQINASHALFVF